MANNYDLARISNSVYGENGAPAGWSRLPIQPPANDAGYYGAAFMNDVTGEIVIAHRGTEALSFDGDLTSDIQMGLNKLPDQYQFVRIPRPPGHGFHEDLDSDSMNTWTAIPRRPGHRFHGELDSLG